MVFNVTFNNSSDISWRSVLLVEKTGVPGEIKPNASTTRTPSKKRKWNHLIRWNCRCLPYCKASYKRKSLLSLYFRYLSAITYVVETLEIDMDQVILHHDHKNSEILFLKKSAFEITEHTFISGKYRVWGRSMLIFIWKMH